MCDRPYVQTPDVRTLYCGVCYSSITLLSNLIKEGEVIELTRNRMTSLSSVWQDQNISYTLWVNAQIYLHCPYWYNNFPISRNSMEQLSWRDQPVEPMCPEGQIGLGGALIETCRRLIDVLALVSGLFQTTMLIAGFRSWREKSIWPERSGTTLCRFNSCCIQHTDRLTGKIIVLSEQYRDFLVLHSRNISVLQNIKLKYHYK